MLCRLEVLSNQIVPPSKSRIRFALVTSTDLSKNRVTVSADTFTVRRYHYSRDRRGFSGKVSLKDMFWLNMFRVDEKPEHFG